MDDRKAKIQLAKRFFDEFLKLMTHYDCVSESDKKLWKMSMNPEEYADEPKPTPQQDRESKIA